MSQNTLLLGQPLVRCSSGKWGLSKDRAAPGHMGHGMQAGPGKDPKGDCVSRLQRTEEQATQKSQDTIGLRQAAGRVQPPQARPGATCEASAGGSGIGNDHQNL